MVLCGINYLTAFGVGLFFIVSGALLKGNVDKPFETRFRNTIDRINVFYDDVDVANTSIMVNNTGKIWFHCKIGNIGLTLFGRLLVFVC